MTKLAGSRMAQHRYAERTTSVFAGARGRPLDCGTVNDLTGKIARSGYTLQDRLWT